MRLLLERDEFPRPVSDFILHRIDDALAGISPEAVVTIERLGWLEERSVRGRAPGPPPDAKNG